MLLEAKPIIDIDIIHCTQDDFEKIKSGLEKLGYNHQGNQGIADREVFIRSQNIVDEVSDPIQHHLNVCSHDSVALERHILARDFMRKNEWFAVSRTKVAS